MADPAFVCSFLVPSTPSCITCCDSQVVATCSHRMLTLPAAMLTRMLGTKKGLSFFSLPADWQQVTPRHSAQEAQRPAPPRPIPSRDPMGS
jgi:hypothetical protein